MGDASGTLTGMIADDDELIRNVIAIYFSGKGHRVVAVSNGEECLELVRLSEPDVLLLDVKVPVLDGWEVCRRIREFSTVPIVMLTARAQAGDKEMGVAMGASAYVTKPVSLKELEARIRALVAPPSRDPKAV
jgi:DNA-binding response OmpR family regulator